MSTNLLTVKDLAPMLNVKPGTLYQWAELRQIPHLKINGAVRFDLGEIKPWIESCKVAAESRYNPLVQSRGPRKGGK